jgi:hypothetical protein
VLVKAKVGVRLRRFREERGLTQAALAQALGISPSYVNQIESNQRPITAPVLLKLAAVFEVDFHQFSTDDADRLTGELRDVLIDSEIGEKISNAEMRELAENMPAIARHVVEIHSRYRHALTSNETIISQIDDTSAGLATIPPPLAYEEVRDLFYAKRNYFATLDETAEEIFNNAGLVIGQMADGIAAQLSNRHKILIVDLPDDDASGIVRSYNPETNVLAISSLLNAGQRAFQLATHLALVEAGDLIDQIIVDSKLSSRDTQSLVRIGLANYFAGALVLPYLPFLEAAEGLRYDIDLLVRRFHVGFETVAHRLSTLQRPGARGVPFIFVRVDRAGNISKRVSATNFHFSRVGGSCPLWNVHEAFSYPDQVHSQLAQMPDGRSYMWIARTVSRSNGGYGTPSKTFSIGLGCDLHHAHRLVYSDGLDLSTSASLTPIGPGCKVCDRENCPQRAFPAIGKPLYVNANQSRFVPYAFGAE